MVAKTTTLFRDCIPGIIPEYRMAPADERDLNR